MPEQQHLVSVMEQDSRVRVHLLRPSAGTNITEGMRINGIGWVVSDTAVSAVEIQLGESRPGLALLGLSATDLAVLTGHAPSDAVTGFVFTVTVPRLPPGPVTLAMRVQTDSGRFDDDIELNMEGVVEAAPHRVRPRPVEIEPVRAMIEAAAIDERGILRAAGWIVSLPQIRSLQVFLGSRLTGEAQRQLIRKDVEAAFPDYANASTAGFLLKREVTDADLQEEDLHVVVTAHGGLRRRFTAKLTRPQRLQRRPPEIVADLAVEEVVLTSGGQFTIKGWAVASSGVAEVIVELDDEVIGVTSPAEERPDVGNRYPRIAEAGQAGFRLQKRLDGRFDGHHVVRVTVRGGSGEAHTSFQALAVQQDEETPGYEAPEAWAPADAGIRCHLDLPACRDGVAIETVRGFLSLTGWAFAGGGIDRIEVFVDQISQGRAHHGIRREDLQTAFPEHDTARAGFAMLLPPQVMKPGDHQVRIEIHDRAGRVEQIGFAVHAKAGASGPGPWMLRTKLPQAEIDLQHTILAAAGYAPRHAILILATNADPASIERSIESVCAQAYEGWQLVIATTGDAGFKTPDLPDEWRGRLRVVPIEAACPLADLAGDADFVMVLSAGDVLGEDALLEMSLDAMLDPQADFIYADERRVDHSDGKVKAFFKPDLSPDLLLSTNYVGRAWAASPALLRRVDLRQGELLTFGGYDAVLRLSEQARQVLHVAKVLYEQAGRGEPGLLERQALRRALQRRGVRGRVAAGPIRGTHRIRRDSPRHGMVSIIMPTNASRGLIGIAIGSIRKFTMWPSYEIICVDNIPRDGTAEQLRWKAWLATHADVTIEIAAAFNWSRFNNRAAKRARGEFLLFLNDDVEVRDEDWLHGLVEQAQRPEIGVVGPQLLYPDGRVQHAGMFLGRHAARHAFRFYPHDEPGPFGLALIQRDVISVTGACMMMRREVFDGLGGFNEAHAVINNDLDFNLRVRRSGRAVVYTPGVSLIHHEAVSRVAMADLHDAPAFSRQWSDLFLKGDPFFSRYFSLDHDDYVPDAEPVRQFAAGRPLIARRKLRRILAVKVDHIGDFITALPAFRRIKQQFPAAELTVLAASASLSLAALEPAIDRVVEFNFYHARSEKGRRQVGPRELAELRLRLAPQRFDLAIDLRRQPDTRSILPATGARWLAGFENGYQHPFLDIAVEFEGDVAQRRKRQHVTDSLVALVDAVSAQCEGERRMVLDPPARDAARGLLARLLPAASGATRLVCVHTGAGALNKQWPAGSFAGLIDLLAGEQGATIVVIGGRDEAAFAQTVLARVRRRDAVHSLVGKTGLRDLPSVLLAADLYVGNDSGPKHIAAALGVPTVGIHSGSVDAGEWGGVGPHALMVRRDVTCSPCYLAFASDCHRNLTCLDGIRVADVAAACRRMLAIRHGAP